MHDECDHIQTNQSTFNLLNNDTKSAWHCNCEIEFYDCLHRINSTLSNHIGELYFSTHERCYRNDYLIFDCYEYDESIERVHRCIRYMLIILSPITNQWFDLPFYQGKSMKTSLFVVNDGRF